MSAAKHTPVPWKFGPGYGKRPAWEQIQSSGGVGIATIHQCIPTIIGLTTPRSNSEAEANGRLILAAVNSHDDLLAACRAALAQIDPCDDLSDDEPDYATAQILKSAISRAEKGDK